MAARRQARGGEELQDIRDAVCLDAYNDLISVKALSLIVGVSRWTIWRWIKRARENPAPPDLEIWMNGVGKACRHGKPIVPGMPVLCVDCMQTGVPEHPAFRRGKVEKPSKPKTDPDGIVFVQEAGPIFYPILKPHKSRNRH